MRFVNEYKYAQADTVTALNAFNRYWRRKLIGRYGALVLAAGTMGLYIGTGLTRFLVFSIIFIVIFALSLLQVFLGAKFDAARIAADYTLRCIEITRTDPGHWYGVKFEPVLPDYIQALQ